MGRITTKFSKDGHSVEALIKAHDGATSAISKKVVCEEDTSKHIKSEAMEVHAHDGWARADSTLKNNGDKQATKTAAEELLYQSTASMEDEGTHALDSSMSLGGELQPTSQSQMCAPVNITGYSGKFPNSGDIHEFWEKLRSGTDLVGPSKRYPPGYLGLPNRAGHLNDDVIDRFDMSFFKLNKKQTDGIDPQTRMLLECTVEALQDANVDLKSLAGSRTGVYIGCCFTDYHNWLLTHDPERINGYENVGSAISMGPNKISYFLDLKGPSMAIDTACSSSLVAMDTAIRDITSGRIDKAIVGGVSLTLRPHISKSFDKYKMLSPTGTCHSFSGDADGYCRSEAVGVLFLERASDAPDRGYVTVLGSGVNSDGHTPEGITFPSQKRQAELMQEVVQANNINAGMLEYIEAHGTGTVAGDGVEIAALDAMYGSADRAIKLGSVKSNMGHPEGASGMMAMIKLMLCYEHGLLVPNLHYKQPTHEPITAGRFEVVTHAQPWNRGYSAISNFGFGGTSAHVVLKCGPYTYTNPPSGKTLVYGRTTNIPLAPPPTYKNVDMYNYRGVVDEGRLLATNRIQTAQPPVCWVISGQGSNWLSMGKDLLDHTPFSSLLTRLGGWIDMDLHALFHDGSRWFDKALSTIGICVIELFLINHLKSIGQSFDFVIGHSMGELCAAYADGAMTEEQVVRMAKFRSELASRIPQGFLVKIDHSPDGVPVNTELTQAGAKVVAVSTECTIFSVSREDAPKYAHLGPVDMLGTMVVVGESAEFVQPLLQPYPMTVIACYNSPKGLTLSGPKAEVEALLRDILRAKPGTYVQPVETGGVAYHSPSLSPFKAFIQESLSSVLPDATPRSDKWLTTSGGHTLQSDALYHANNILAPVYFYDALQKLPPNTLVLEVGPSSSLLSQVKRTREDFVSVASFERNKPEMASLGMLEDRLWLNGVTLAPERHSHGHYALQHRHHHSWDHSVEYFVPSYKDFESDSGKNITYDLHNEHAFLLDHVIDGRQVFPATGHIYTVWKKVGLNKSIRVTDYRIHRAVLLEGLETVSFMVQQTGDQFGIYYEGEEVASGVVHTDVDVGRAVKNIQQLAANEAMEYVDANALYNSLARHGYHYKSAFRLIQRQSVDGTLTTLGTSTNHMIAYLDNMLQCALKDVACLRLPTSIKEIVVLSSTMGADVEYNHHCMTIQSQSVLIRGMHTTPAPVQKSEQLVNRAPCFVEYGRTHMPSPALLTYGQQVVATVTASLVEFLKESTNRDKFPWLGNNVLSLSEEVPRGGDCEYSDNPTHSLYTIVRDLCSTPAKLEVFMQNPMLALSTHSLHGGLYKLDMYTALDPSWAASLFAIVQNELPRQRILEIGAGTGAMTTVAVSALGKTIERYHATDVSQISVEKHDDRFTTFKYDINDVMASNNKYNLIVASNAVHTAASLRNGLQNLLDVLEPDGMILLDEFISAVPCFLWGLDKFVWETPTDERAYGLWLSVAQWDEVYRDLGLVVVKMFTNDAHMAVLVKRRTKKTGVVCRTWSAVQSAITQNTKVHFVDENGSFGLVRTLLLEGHDVHAHASQNAVGLEKDELQMRFNAYHGEKHGTYVTMPMGPPPTVTGNHRLSIVKPGDLSTLGWERVPDREVTVVVSPLNFKDVMYAFGKLKLSSPSFGLEYAGYAGNDPNDRSQYVMGFGSEGCIAQKVKRELCWSVPGNMTLEDAATIPVVYSTVYYALFEKARLERGQSVLIHAGAGGVGNAALNVCLKRGLRVFTTCSEGKRDKLKADFGLSDDQICDSRSSSFRDFILEQTHGEGVDCVLNCLSGEILEASLEVVKPFGHFCEIGKFDLMNNTKIGIRCFSENISFHAIDLSSMVTHPEMSRVLFRLVQEGLDRGEIVPLTYRTFAKDRVEEALRYMAGAHHHGKVLIDMVSSTTATAALVPVSPRFLTSGTHVITGGLGGFGLELAHWLVEECGAERLVLTSRSGPTNGHQVRRLAELKKKKCEVVVSHLDVVDPVQCAELVEMFRGDLMGVWHTAMVLKDTLFENMTQDSWDACVQTKKQAFENLSDCTKDLSLDIFCGFSSVVSMSGNLGQGNYAYANNAMETLVQQRRERSEEYKSKRDLVVQWGIIGNVGFVSRVGEGTVQGTTQYAVQGIDACLDNLHMLIASVEPVVSSYKEVSITQSSSSTNMTFREWFLSSVGLSTDTDRTMSFGDLGLDSLQTVETRNKLASFGIEKTTKDIASMTLNDVWDI